MATIQMVLISGILGIAVCGLVWFGWDLVKNLVASLRAPKLSGSVSKEESTLDSAPPSEKAKI